MSKRAARGCRDTTLGGENLQQFRACCSGGNLLTLGEDIRNLLRQLFVRPAASPGRTGKTAREKNTQQGNKKCFHIPSDGKIAKMLQDAQLFV